jgi:uncharacterized protein YjdB
MGRIGKNVNILGLLVVMLFTFILGAIGQPVKAAVAAGTGNASTLKSADNSKFVTANNTTVTVSASAASNMEMFDVVKGSDGYYSIRNKLTGYYLTYTARNTALTVKYVSSLTDNEKFTRVDTGGYVTFQTKLALNDNKRYISVSDNKLYVNTSKNTDDVTWFTLGTTTVDIIKVLEVTESGLSDLSSIFGPLLYIDTYSMKEFVASRDYLDGKYDAIYIGKGTISSSKKPYTISLLSTQTQGSSTQSSNHNTSLIQNDITQLKANEITNDFINKGLPVIFYSDSTNKDGFDYQENWTSGSVTKEALLKKNFLKYKTSSNTNVMFVNRTNLSSASSFLTDTSLLTKGNLRPQLTVTSSPTDYTTNQTNKYVAGNTISFNYSIDNVGDITKKNIDINLFIGTDSALPFEAEQLVASKQKVTATTGTISYVLPKGHSGVQYWRLEAEDFNSKLKDVKAGVYRFQDQKIDIKVLQVMPTDSGASNLNTTSNMRTSYLVPASDSTNYNDYKIAIDVINMNTFNSSGYKTLNGKYDMLIFGFGDIYNNNAPINNDAAAAVIQFINTGQSVMFTHDTIYNSSNSNSANWLNKFQTITGQIAPRTDLGLGAPESSTKTEKVNNGLLTQFPFILSSTTQVANTHNQYYTLDLEDSTVIPWYNMSGGDRTSGDSWNSYYTYSKENVTYSGSGHTNNNFPDWEQQLFVNTMYRAYIGSNHAPQLTVNAPVEYNATNNNFIPSYQDVLVNYQVDDFDLSDRELTTSVNFIYDGVSHPIITDRPILAGGTINELVQNPLPNGGDLTVQIIAKDGNGAEVNQLIIAKVQKVTANIELNRTVSSNVFDGRIQTNTAATYTYTITPKPIAKSSGVSNMTITSTFNEKLPANLEVSGLPSYLRASGTSSSGITVSGTIPNITYSLSGNNYIASPVTFTLSVTPKKDGQYSLQDAKLTFSDVGNQAARTLSFPVSVLEALTRITTLSLPNTSLLVGDTRKMLPAVTPADATYRSTFTWTSDNTSVVTVDSSGIITGIKAGTAIVSATATDGSGLTARATITVIKPGLNILGPDNVATGEEISLTGSLFTADYDTIKSYSWTSNSNNVSIDSSSASTSTAIITGKNKGTATVTLTVTTEKGTYTKDVTLTIYKKVESITLTGTTLVIGDTYRITAAVNPADASNTTVRWLSSSNSDVFSVKDLGNNTALITAVGVGNASVIAAATDDSGVSGSAVISVIEPKPTISGPSTVDLGKSISFTADMTSGSNDPIDSYTWTVDAAGKDNVSGSSTGSSYSLTGIKAGEAKVTVTVKTNSGRTYTSDPKTVTVNKVTLKLKSSYRIKVNAQLDLFSLLASSPRAGKTNIKDNLIWTSSDSNTVRVDATNGKITAVKPGTATITVTYRYDSTVKATTTVTVEKPTTSSTTGSKY